VNEAILTPAKVRFDVAAVTPAAEPLPQSALGGVFASNSKTKLLICHDPETPVVAAEQFHSLIAAAAIAYKHHYPLTLTPDALWLTILQGVAQHVQNHSERLRSRLVQHQTKIELVVDTVLEDLPANTPEMLGLTQAFAERIFQHLQLDKRSLLRAEFSTTTEIERIAGAVALMDALQPYFDYIFSIICGIPSVILEGAPSDWELLENKVGALHASDLELSWWTGELLPLCAHFVRAANGDVDRAHWNNLLKIVERYGVDDLNGWLLKFIPYVRKDLNAPLVQENPVLHLSSFDEPADSEYSPFTITGCTSDMLPSGIASAPVLCKSRANGGELRMQFLAGLAAVSQFGEDLSLKPVIAWAIGEEPGIDALIARIRKEHGCAPPKSLETQKLVENFDGRPPGDLWKFYVEVDGISLPLRQPNRWGETSCQIFPLRDVKFLFEISRPACAAARHFQLFSCIAQASDGQHTSSYFLGYNDEKRGLIYRWTGKPDPAAFTLVADSFLEWLTALLAYASPSP